MPALRLRIGVAVAGSDEHIQIRRTLPQIIAQLLAAAARKNDVRHEEIDVPAAFCFFVKLRGIARILRK